MLPSPTLLISVALAWLLSLGLAAGLTNHYTAKYYRAQIAAAQAEGERNAAKANLDQRQRETLAASRSAASGVKAAVEVAQLASERDTLLAKLAASAGSVHSLTDAYWLLARAAGDRSKASDDAIAALFASGRSAESSAAECAADRQELTRTGVLNNAALAACKVQVRGLVSTYEGVRLSLTGVGP